MRGSLAALAVLAAASPALAGDFAEFDTLGFSGDGRVFAFEQYGVQDGSGYAYADIVFVDLDEDRMLAPSPVRVLLENMNDSVEDARTEARRRAALLFEEHRPDATRDRMVAANPASELTADPYRLVFLPRLAEPSIDAPVELRLDLVPLLEAPQHCEGLDRSVMGFRLTRTPTEPGATVVVIHEDGGVPESRNCPYDYRLIEIRVFGEIMEARRAVALIGVKSVGFEGPDMRYIAVPVPLD